MGYFEKDVFDSVSMARLRVVLEILQLVPGYSPTFLYARQAGT